MFAIDASGSVPVAKATNGAYAHVGTTLFNMAVNPKSGKLYVTNTDAHNDVRFEGHNDGFTTVRGHITDSRITVIDPAAGSVAPRTSTRTSTTRSEGNAAEKALSGRLPAGRHRLRRRRDALHRRAGLAKLAIYTTADVEAGNPTPSLANQVVLSGGGPTGVAVSDASHLAFVLTRFDNSISVVDTNAKKAKWARSPCSTPSRPASPTAASTSTTPT